MIWIILAATPLAIALALSLIFEPALTLFVIGVVATFEQCGDFWESMNCTGKAVAN